MTGNTRTLHVIFDFHTLEKEKNLPRRKIKKKDIRHKMASSLEQDLHPDWDRFRGIMLYLLSCGELAINGK